MIISSYHVYCLKGPKSKRMIRDQVSMSVKLLPNISVYNNNICYRITWILDTDMILKTHLWMTLKQYVIV